MYKSLKQCNSSISLLNSLQNLICTHPKNVCYNMYDHDLSSDKRKCSNYNMYGWVYIQMLLWEKMRNKQIKTNENINNTRTHFGFYIRRDHIVLREKERSGIRVSLIDQYLFVTRWAVNYSEDFGLYLSLQIYYSFVTISTKKLTTVGKKIQKILCLMGYTSNKWKM